MLDHLTALAAKPERKIVGLMSGTSMDGIDAALVRVQGTGLECRAELVRYQCLSFEAELRDRLLRAASGESLSTGEFARLDFQVGISFAKAALAVIEASGLQSRSIDLIGSHGQTLFHHASGTGAWDPEAATWQAGRPAIIAALSGVPTIGDFRSADVALGGHGAPLVPYVDFLLRRSARESRLLLNLGGIANVTYLRAGAGLQDVAAWDVGPGNLVLDGMAHVLLGRDRDENGEHAARGHADTDWVGTLLTADYFERPFPKSAGREEFGSEYTRRLLEEGKTRGLGPDDLLATAVELTVRGIQRAQEQLAPQSLDAVYASGGGRRNTYLMQRLQAVLEPVPVRGFEVLGLDPDAKEAVDFAVLANETLFGHAGNLTQVTGAQRPCILGVIAPAGLFPRELQTNRAAEGG